MRALSIICTLLLCGLASAAPAQPAPERAQQAGPETGTFAILSLTPETAIKAVQAALKSCRAAGYQVSVAVVDRGGVVQALMRDRLAGPHTPDTAIRKAYTANSFRNNSADMAEATQADKPSSGLRQIPGTIMVGGGLKIEAGGAVIGGIGVSGTPAGNLDDQCAKAGLDAIAQDLPAR